MVSLCSPLAHSHVSMVNIATPDFRVDDTSILVTCGCVDVTSFLNDKHGVFTFRPDEIRATIQASGYFS